MTERPNRLAATYSIVARDAATNELGVAVQSNYFSVGTEVTWAEPGIGAIATQSIVEKAYGPRALDRMSGGASAAEALEQLVAEDLGAALRQVAVIDHKGQVAVHTGVACVPAAGHVTGSGYSIQANMVESEAVWHEMAAAFEEAKGDLAERLLCTLEAGDRAGGDVRGRQSAALLVVSGSAVENAWEGRLFDLHVEDDPQPLEELRRLLVIRRAYALFEEARSRIGTGDVDGALALVERAIKMRPNDPQFSFWTAVALANGGREAEARTYFARCFAAGDAWRRLAERLREVGLYSGDPSLLES